MSNTQSAANNKALLPLAIGVMAILTLTLCALPMLSNGVTTLASCDVVSVVIS